MMKSVGFVGPLAIPMMLSANLALPLPVVMMQTRMAVIAPARAVISLAKAVLSYFEISPRPAPRAFLCGPRFLPEEHPEAAA